MKMYVQMMQQMTGQQARTSTSSEDLLVAPTLSGTGPEFSAGIAAVRPSSNVGFADPSNPGKKGLGKPQRMSQMLKNKLMMTNPLAFNMFGQGGLPDEATGEEEEQSGPLQSGSMEMTPYMSSDNNLFDSGNGFSQTDMHQQQMMAESLRPMYGTAADPDTNPNWQRSGQNQMQQGNWNSPKGLLALPAPASSLGTQASDVLLQFDQPARAGIGQFGSGDFAQAQNAAYQQKLMQQKQLKQQQQQLQQQSALSDSMQSGSTGQFGTALMSPYQQQLQQQHSAQLSQPGDTDDASFNNSQLSSSQSVAAGLQQQQSGQFGSAGFAQSQNPLYQQKLLLQRQKQQQLQQQQQQQLPMTQGSAQFGQGQAAMYQQLQPQPQQQMQQSPMTQAGSAQFAQNQAAMYQQKLQQAKLLKQQQQQSELSASSGGLNNLGQSQAMQRADANSPESRADGNSPGAAVTQQVGSVGYALAQNAKYQQMLQQQQARRQQRQSQLGLQFGMQQAPGTQQQQQQVPQQVAPQQQRQLPQQPSLQAPKAQNSEVRH